ncbi:PrGVORF69 [Pieris rapae granulovirus Wuhan]|uniref:PrGVORF69 n=1 Tax=Pieris rapae granulovirus Wuhan TaxID=2848030 RepID=D2J4N6_9BBAC|nr:PrGVORF69 [Betabaculovirus arrapae]ACZ63555.1 PrGVORF69 [Betabaculovirus arrapae]ADO85498.1 unknown [Pieris rapae granulovirus]AGS18829.1 ORF69 [Pieris rapae granulovirus]UOS85744.1 ORF69 [Pieris rapae granulovirus]
MEDSLFNRADESQLDSSPATLNDNTLLHALLMQGVGRHIKEDNSAGKKNILKKLSPKTRSLKRLLKGLEDDEDELLVRGADDAVEILEVVYGIINSKFVISNEPELMES